MLTSKPLMRKGEAGTHKVAVSRMPGRCAGCRLGDPSASISPLETLLFLVSGEKVRCLGEIFGSQGLKLRKGEVAALSAHPPTGARLALPKLEGDFHQFPWARGRSSCLPRRDRQTGGRQTLGRMLPSPRHLDFGALRCYFPGQVTSSSCSHLVLAPPHLPCQICSSRRPG